MLNLIVGCGGTGLATIEALCERLAYSRKRKFAEYAFLAIDSDPGVIGHFKDYVHSLFGSNQPVVGLLQLGRGHGMRDIVEAHFIAPFWNGNNPEGRERLQRHWWHDANGRPYGGNRPDAPFLDSHNAIDCYGMTWHDLDKIEEVIHDLICRSASAKSVNVHVISSLVGATGRGCWSLVAFIIRQTLRRWGISARQTGILFDAMAFAELFPRDSSFALRCKVNSLTGLSELSCWEGNEKRVSPICFNLPSLSRPESNKLDLIRTEGNLSLARGPVDELRLIGETFKRPQSQKGYVKEAADALYMATASNTLAAGRVNLPLNFSSHAVESCGAAAFEVNVVDIDKYCSTRAYDVALARILDSDEDVSPEVAKFFEALPINTIPGTINDIRPNPDGGGSIIQRLSFELVKLYRAEFEGEIERLPQIGREEALKMTGALVGKTTAERVEGALKKALLSLGIEGGSLEKVSALVEDFALRVFSGDQHGECSIGRLRNFLMALQSDVAKSLAYPEKVDPPETAAEAIARFSKRTFKEILLHQPRFNAEEMAMLIRNVGGGLHGGIIVDQFLCDAYGEMRYAVGKLVACVQKKVHSLISAVDRIQEGCRTVRGDLEKHGYGFSQTGVEAFNAVFILPGRCLEAIGDEGRVRILKPIVESRESVDHLIGQHLSLHPELGDFLRETIGRLSAEGQGKFDSESLRRELSEQIKSKAHLDVDFLERNYPFLKILERDRSYWNGEIKRVDATGDADRSSAIDAFFLKVLGAMPERSLRSMGTRALPPVEELKYTIIETFLMRTLPCMEVNGTAKVTRQMTVFVPFYAAEEKAGECKHGMSRRDDTRVEICDLKDDASSLYAYLANVTEDVRPNRPVVPTEIGRDIPGHGKNTEEPSSASRAPARPFHVFDAFRSLEYYWDPKVLEKLKEVEREDGKPIFDPDPALGPIGYVSPLYVRDADWSAARWKPWADQLGDDCSKTTD